MAKKKNVVQISDEELTPTVLATIEEKKGNSILLLILFAIFIAVVFFLPDITNYVDSYLNPEIKSNTPIVNNPTNSNEEEEVTITKYNYSDKLTIDKKKFTLTDFSIADNTLSFKINNIQSGTLSMNNFNYYLELYSSDNTLLQRIKVDDITVNSNSSVDLKYAIENNNVSYFTFIEISKDEYPAYTPSSDKDGKATMVCTKDKEKINYILNNNKLTTIEDYYEVNQNDENYETLLTTYQSLATTYNALEGVTSYINIEDSKFTFSTYFDLSNNNSLNVSKIVYPKDTTAKVIKFELNARGYVCE